MDKAPAWRLTPDRCLIKIQAVGGSTLSYFVIS